MPDYRKMYDDKDHFYSFDLDGRDRTFEIESVSAGELTGEKNRKSKKPMVTFVGEKKKLALNKTNGKTIAALYGRDTDEWIGQLITIYPTTTDFGGETVDCIRVRPQRPKDAQTRGGEDARGGSSRRGTQHDRQGGRGRHGGADKASAAAALHLLRQYDLCSSAASMAALKVERGAAWAAMNEADRTSVLEAAKAAKARIDSASSAGTPPPDDDPNDADDATGSEPDADEAAEIARIERERAEAERGRG